jgi:hypothetical protein
MGDNEAVASHRIITGALPSWKPSKPTAIKSHILIGDAGQARSKQGGHHAESAH